MVNPAFWVTEQPNITSSLQFQELTNKSRPDPAARGKMHISSYWDHIWKCESMWIVQNPVRNQSRGGVGSMPSVITQPYTTEVFTAGCLQSWFTLLTREVSAGVLVQVCLLSAHRYKHHTSAPQPLLSQTQPEPSSAFASDYRPCTGGTEIQKFTLLQMSIVLLKMKGG